MIELLTGMRVWDAIDILLVAFVIYRIFVLIKGTRALQILVGLAFLVVAYVVSQMFELFTLHWLLNAFLSSIILVVVVLFQNEIRRGLAHVGMNPFMGSKDALVSEAQAIEELMKASVSLANKKIGALIVIERETDLRDYVEEGIRMDAALTKELVQSIFLPYSPIHDGAVLIQRGRLEWAGCFLPLTTRPDVDRDLGTRHRAALGLTEETDAVVVVVSEERGSISVVLNGRVTRDLDGASLRRVLLRLFPSGRDTVKGSRPRRVRPRRPVRTEAGS